MKDNKEIPKEEMECGYIIETQVEEILSEAVKSEPVKREKITEQGDGNNNEMSTKIKSMAKLHEAKFAEMRQDLLEKITKLEDGSNNEMSPNLKSKGQLHEAKFAEMRQDLLDYFQLKKTGEIKLASEITKVDDVDATTQEFCSDGKDLIEIKSSLENDCSSIADNKIEELMFTQKDMMNRSVIISFNCKGLSSNVKSEYFAKKFEPIKQVLLPLTKTERKEFAEEILEVAEDETKISTLDEEFANMQVIELSTLSDMSEMEEFEGLLLLNFAC